MTDLCEYGCNNLANYQLKNKRWCCKSNTSKCPGIKKKLAHKGARYDYNSLSDEIKTRMSRKGQVMMSSQEVFQDNKEWSSELLRKYIHYYDIFEYKCSSEDCGITDWHGKHLILELDHINGKRIDNRKENLRWLCPNCHSLTDTFRGRNKNPGRQKVSDTELLTALHQYNNIRQALQSVGLAAKGGNYERARKLSNKCPDGGIR